MRSSSQSEGGLEVATSGSASLSFPISIPFCKYLGLMKILGGYLTPFPVGIYVPESVDVVLPAELWY